MVRTLRGGTEDVLAISPTLGLVRFLKEPPSGLKPPAKTIYRLATENHETALPFGSLFVGPPMPVKCLLED
ncbi:hypothetical protein Tco_1066838 [Tanacetum coccineum]|uniref:Uncharacterized protein n=1 Tax=Tanacetum coccineum TaxID=301880 RepID=A0ABQ5HCK8_9ASTR